MSFLKPILRRDWAEHAVAIGKERFAEKIEWSVKEGHKVTSFALCRS